MTNAEKTVKHYGKSLFRRGDLDNKEVEVAAVHPA
jgi:hypothetical protein